MSKTRKKYYLITLSLAVVALFLVLNLITAKSQFIHMPITITPSGTPAVTGTIEGKTYLLKIDLGSKFQLALNKDVLDSINDKKPHGLAQWRDAKGNFYESPAYLIPNLGIGDLVLKDVIVKQESNAYTVNTTLWNDSKNEKNSAVQNLGTLGRPLLEKTNLLLDFQNSTMLASNDKQKLKEVGFFLNNMVQVPFEGGTKGIIIKVDTDAGTLRLGLDTGATVTLIRTSLLQDQKCTKEKHGFLTFNTSKFSIGNKDFGNKNLFLYDITSELDEIDGFLGMDFLENHVVYIDYKDKVIYIGDSQPQIEQSKKLHDLSVVSGPTD